MCGNSQPPRGECDMKEGGDMNKTKESKLNILQAALEDAQIELRRAEERLDDAQDLVDAIKHDIQALNSGHTPGEIITGCLPLPLEMAGDILIKTQDGRWIIEDKDGAMFQCWTHMPSLTDVMEVLSG